MRRKWWRVALTGVVALAFVAGFLVYYLSNPLDKRTKTILAGATRVEVFRLDGDNRSSVEKPAREGDKRIGGFLVTAQGQNQGKAFAAKLADILSDRSTYALAFAGCFSPGVAYRIWKDEESVEVLICFKCHNFYCGPPADSVQENASFVRSPREGDLVRLAKEAFPDDPEIQKLKDR